MYDVLFCCSVVFLSVVMVVMMGRWSDLRACLVVHVVLQNSDAEIVVMSGDDGCCNAVLGSLVGVLVLSVMWSEFAMISEIRSPL